MAFGSIGRLFVEVGADISDLQKGFRAADSEVDKLGKKVKKSGKTIGKGMTTAGKGLTAGVTVPIAAAAAGFMALTGKAAAFENQMNEVFTLMPGISEKAMDAMTQDVLDFSKEMGTLPNESVPALYQAISAGVPKENVFDFMRTANKAAIGGVTTLETAVDGITSVVNAYGSDVISATQASDLMFTAVKQGKTNFDELSRSLFNVIPTASALGVEFGDVTAALATMTAQGTPTSVATTQLRQMFVELSKSTSKTSQAFQEISGVTFQDFIAQGGNVQQALEIMEQAAANNDVSLQDMFGSVEAGNAALALTGKGAASFATNLEEMQGSIGATDTAFAKMDEGASRSLAKMKAEFAAVMIEVGNEFIPILKDDLLPIFRDDIAPLLTDVVVPAIKGAAKAFSAMSPGMKKLSIIVLALAAALGPVLLALGPIITAATALAPVIASVGAIIGGVALGPLVLIVAAIVAAIAILWKLEQRFGIVTMAINQLKKSFGMFFDFIHGLTGKFSQAGKAIMDAFVSGVTRGINKAVNKVRDGLAKIRRLMPGSDAKEGPLSDITASGKALMTTFEKGISTSNVNPSEAFASRAPDVVGMTSGGAGQGSTSNASTINIGTVNLTKDYDFTAMMKDIDKYQQMQRIQRGIGTI